MKQNNNHHEIIEVDSKGGLRLIVKVAFIIKVKEGLKIEVCKIGVK